MTPYLRSMLVISTVWGLVALWPCLAEAQYGAANGEWPTHAGDLGGTKHSVLDQR